MRARRLPRVVTLLEHRLSLHDDRTIGAHWLRRMPGYDGTASATPRARGGRTSDARGEEPAPAARRSTRSSACGGTAKIPLDAARRIEGRCWTGRARRRARAGVRAAPPHEQAPCMSGRRPSASTSRCWRPTRRSRRAHRPRGLLPRGSRRARTATILGRRAAIESTRGRKRLLIGSGGTARKLGAIPDARWRLCALRAAEEGDADVLVRAGAAVRVDPTGRRSGRRAGREGTLRRGAARAGKAVRAQSVTSSWGVLNDPRGRRRLPRSYGERA